MDLPGWKVGTHQVGQAGRQSVTEDKAVACGLIYYLYLVGYRKQYNPLKSIYILNRNSILGHESDQDSISDI